MKNTNTKTCSIENCGKNIVARGWCVKHYYRWKRNGDPERLVSSDYPDTCSVDNCDRKFYAHNLCQKHYGRLRGSGDMNNQARGPRPKTAEEFFSMYAQPDNGCLTWSGNRVRSGYGVILVDKKRRRAHRYAWERVNGPIPDGMQVDHICWNRACVEISHLRLVTNKQNGRYRSGASSVSKSGVRNVYPQGDKWRVEIMKDGKARSYGVYSTVEEAAEVAEEKRLELFGKFAGRG